MSCQHHQHKAKYEGCLKSNETGNATCLQWSSLRKCMHHMVAWNVSHCNQEQSSTISIQNSTMPSVSPECKSNWLSVDEHCQQVADHLKGALEFPVTVPNKWPYDHRYISSPPCTNTSFSMQPFCYSVCVCVCVCVCVTSTWQKFL